MKSIRYLLLLFLIFFSPITLAVSFTSAWSSCQSWVVGKQAYCQYFTFEACEGTQRGLGGAVLAIDDGYTSTCGGGDGHMRAKWLVDAAPNCSGGKEWSNEVGQCVCPSGKVESGGVCINPPADCDSSQTSFSCGEQICTGAYVAPFTCQLNTPPPGCESGIKTFNGCDLVCPGQSTPNAEGTGCDDPTCGSEQYLENHSCHDYPPCIGDQTRNPETHACDDPTCGDGYAVNPTTKMCEFAGCPTGYVQGKIDGSTVCVKSGKTSSGTVSSPDGTITTTQSPDGNTTTTSDGNGGSVTTTKTTNPDGSITTTSTTTGGGITSQKIDLDTEGLAQESTNIGILDTLKQMLGKSDDYNNAGDLSALDNAGPGEDETDGNGFLESGNDGYAPDLDETEWMPDFPTETSCSGTIPIHWRGVSHEFAPCEKLQPLRVVLAWVFYVLSFWNIFHIWVSIKE
jgi:hypothetical protein